MAEGQGLIDNGGIEGVSMFGKAEGGFRLQSSAFDLWPWQIDGND
jgi:hypothetical protein